MRKQYFSIHGKNMGAKYNEESKIFEIQDEIILKIDHVKYKMLEYHFHIPGEHQIHSRDYQSEVHYVFVELDCDDSQDSVALNCEDSQDCKESKESQKFKCPDVCGGKFHFGDISGNILVIGRVIKPTERKTDIHHIQVAIPERYFEYDGTLTTGKFSPVRWIVGCNSIHMNICEIEPYHKPARPLQQLDGRIILHVD